MLHLSVLSCFQVRLLSLAFCHTTTRHRSEWMDESLAERLLHLHQGQQQNIQNTWKCLKYWCCGNTVSTSMLPTHSLTQYKIIKNYDTLNRQMHSHIKQAIDVTCCHGTSELNGNLGLVFDSPQGSALGPSSYWYNRSSLHNYLNKSHWTRKQSEILPMSCYLLRTPAKLIL